jgi:long-chain fatty acid transport protein
LEADPSYSPNAFENLALFVQLIPLAHYLRPAAEMINKRNFHILHLVAAISMLAFGTVTSFADGIYRNGVGARAMALGGADAAWAEDPLGAMAANPAALGVLTSPGFNLGLAGASASGLFSKGSSQGGLDSTPGVFPEAAFAMPLANTPVTFGVAFIPDAVRSDWHFADPPSSGGTSYGYQEHKSEIVLLRSAAGLGISLGDKWSIGGSVALLYNENTLDSPYTFQTQPTLKGAKTLLDLNTRGFGVDGQIGLLFRPVDTVQLALTYTTPSTVDSHGHASGDAYAQFGVQPGTIAAFNYDAEVKNHFPQMVRGGLSWKLQPKWRLALQIDWINWRSAFAQLPVNLSSGNNSVLNGLLGSTSLQDTIPLQWRDEFVYRAGLEYAVMKNLLLRGGYCYGGSPVPSQTLTPMTAVLMEHTLTAGIGYHWSRYAIDLGYQYDIPITRNVGASSLQAGEFSNSSTTVSLQWLALTAGIRF